jgi:hypothetical protein
MQLPFISLNNLQFCSILLLLSNINKGQTPNISLPLYSYISPIIRHWVKIQTV